MNRTGNKRQGQVVYAARQAKMAIETMEAGGIDMAEAFRRAGLDRKTWPGNARYVDRRDIAHLTNLAVEVAGSREAFMKAVRQYTEVPSGEWIRRVCRMAINPRWLYGPMSRNVCRAQDPGWDVEYTYLSEYKVDWSLMMKDPDAPDFTGNMLATASISEIIPRFIGHPDAHVEIKELTPHKLRIIVTLVPHQNLFSRLRLMWRTLTAPATVLDYYDQVEREITAENTSVREQLESIIQGAPVPILAHRNGEVILTNFAMNRVMSGGAAGLTPGTEPKLNELLAANDWNVWQERTDGFTKLPAEGVNVRLSQEIEDTQTYRLQGLGEMGVEVGDELPPTLLAFMPSSSLEATHDAIEQQRQEMAELLHDDLGQRLSAIKLASQNGDTSRIAEQVEDAHQVCRELARSQYQLLGPGKSLDSGAKLILQRQQVLFPEVKIEAMIEMEVQVAPARAEEALCILREALQNACLHGDGSGIELKLTVTEGIVTLLVTNQARTMTTNRNESLGLRLMRARADRLRGYLEFSIQDDLSTVLKLTFPEDTAG